jgi:hypothetical protein
MDLQEGSCDKTQQALFHLTGKALIASSYWPMGSNARELHEQMNSCSCLTLILACVISWQAKEISRVVRCREPQDGDIDVVMLEHVSPIEWDNVMLYGQYVLDHDQVR